MELVKSEKLEKSMQELQFSVDAGTFAAAVDKAFRREGKKYTVPGFRKGKAPRRTLEKMYGEDLFTTMPSTISSPRPMRRPSRRPGSSRWAAPKWTLCPPRPRTALYSR